MSHAEEPAALRESIELDQWLADLASLEGNDRLMLELEARVREKRGRLKSLAHPGSAP